jgi:D-lactate dehydrogenase
MIGGIAANNASGMCCGTAQNSYRTVESMKIIFHDGTVLDTADPDSRRSFLASHAEMIRAIEEIRDEIAGDNALRQRIRDKFRIKNTTGYSINAFVDFSDPIDILLRLMVGSEGTLGFIAEVTYRTVEEHAHNASSLILFPDIGNACRATIRLKTGPVSAVELMDRASLRSVEGKEGMPAYLKTLGDSATGLLVETRAGDADTLARQVEEILGMLPDIPTVFPAAFSDQKAECEKLWNVRKGLFPAVGAARKIGTTVVIEDVVFPIETLADATLELEGLMKKHGYDEGIIFGHALEGNLHFVFTQDFSGSAEVARYQRLMEDVCEMVVGKYDGSLKGEHGTGRNMAPFVEMEWGEKAYALMKRIKQAFDPKRLLNPGVILNDNPRVYLEDLKPLPVAHEIIDKCTECGFCEVVCPSKDLTSTPRQRIVIRREISRLRSVRSDGQALARFEADYRYLGEQTCATDGLCATTCPVSINTGEHTKELRSLQIGRFGHSAGRWAAGHYATVTAGVRGGLAALGAARAVLGDRALGSVARGLRTFSGDRLPLWNSCMPNAAPAKTFQQTSNGSARKVVYFPSCIVRTMGPSPGDPDQRALFEAVCSEAALLACSRDGEYPVLFDTSPCLYTVKQNPDPRLRIYEPVEFIHSFLLDALEFTKIPETIAVHVPCSSIKLGLREKFLAVAGACAETVVVPDRVGCCGVAGDRVFFFPELSESALSALRNGLPGRCRSGYSSSRACEIGLSLQSGLPYQSIAYLVDRCTARKGDLRPLQWGT